MAKNWWFKFDFRVWRTDSALRRCSVETRGFWLEVLCIMHETDEPVLTGSFEELARLIGCESSDVVRCVNELKRTGTADVTLGNGFVTLMSRRLKRELSDREQTRLRVQRHRGNAVVTEVKRDRVISKSKSKKKEEEEEGDETPPLPSQSLDLEMEQSPFDHPAVVLYTEKFGLNISRAFAKEIAETVKDLSAWSGLITDKIGYADGTLDERKRISRWFMGAYRERIAAKPVTAKLPSTTEKALSEASARSQLVTPEQMGMSL
jgi:hypothetical protein